MTDARGQAEQTDAGTGDVEALCVLFHDAYEAAAAGAGWETQERSRKPWADVPEANKETMRATIRAILASDWLAAHTAAAKREGARAVVEAVETAAREWTGEPSMQAAHFLAAAREAAARVGGA